MSTPPKKQLLEEFAAIGRSLGNGHRLEILEHLAQNEKSVDVIAESVSISIGNASQHLQYLKRAGLVVSRKDGKFVMYRLTDDTVIHLLQILFRLGEQNLAEVDKILRGYFYERDAMEPISHKELVDRTKKGLVTVLDVRPQIEFGAGHIPGAVNVPLEELETRLAEIDTGKEVVAYCRGPYCVLSFEAVAALRAKGIKARRLEDGMPEWRASGLPVQVQEI